MATQALQTVVSPDRIEVIISDHLDVDQAHVLVRISYRIQGDYPVDKPLRGARLPSTLSAGGTHGSVVGLNYDN